VQREFIGYEHLLRWQNATRVCRQPLRVEVLTLCGGMQQMRSIFLEPSYLEDFSYCMTSHDEIILRYAASKLGGYLDTQRVRAV
jgi:hypothetical protein